MFIRTTLSKKKDRTYRKIRYIKFITICSVSEPLKRDRSYSSPKGSAKGTHMEGAEKASRTQDWEMGFPPYHNVS